MNMRIDEGEPVAASENPKIALAPAALGAVTPAASAALEALASGALAALPADHRTWSYADVPEDDRPEREAYEIDMVGPWTYEPDKVQWVDPETGLDCLIVRNRMGSLCGYVGVAPGHPAYDAAYDEVDVQVHGGLTFANYCTPGEPVMGICHVPYEGREAKVYWLGFDCGHAFDFQPGMHCMERRIMPDLLQKYGKDVPYDHFEVIKTRDEWGTERYREVGYVINEVTELAEQLKAMA